jgi:hypothetical protein
MKSAGKLAVLILLAAFVAGCRHKAQATPPPAAQAPVLPVSESTKNTPPPKMPPPLLPAVIPPSPKANTPPPKPHKPSHHKVKHTEVPAEPPAKSPGTEVASNGGGSDMTPIGELSAAGESTNTPRRNKILDEINATEKSLNDIKRPLDKEEQTTAAQIRTFLTKAKGALDQEDLDGAQILATKAKVLLDELTKT